jgi:hypothetical protein
MRILLINPNTTSSRLVPTRLEIAEHWHRQHRALARDAHVIG